jgi:hypothetical protein
LLTKYCSHRTEISTKDIVTYNIQLTKNNFNEIILFQIAPVQPLAVTSRPTLKGGHVFASNDAAAIVTAARTVADGGIDGAPPRRVSLYAASSMLALEKGKRNKNGTKDIGIQA